jgi:hypothetical protein
MELEKEHFLIEAREKHGDKYDYMRVEYVDKNTPVTIICNEHGECLLTPIQHLRGAGCIKCVKTAFTQQPYTNLYIQKATLIHGDKYNYFKTIYINENTKICIISEAGEFYQLPADHLVMNDNSEIEYKPCDYLLYKNAKNTNNFVQQATLKHGDKYYYKNIRFHNDNTKIGITCKVHGYLLQTPAAHLANDDDCITCQLQSEEKIAFLSSKNTPEDNARSKICLEIMTIIMNAEKKKLSLKSQQYDAEEFLTSMKKLNTAFITVRNTFSNSLPENYNRNDPTKLANAQVQFKTMLQYDNEYMTTKKEFQQLYTKYKNETKNLEYSVVKKIVQIYEFEQLMNKKTIDNIIGILEEFCYINKF